MRAFTTLLCLPLTLVASLARGAEPAQVFRGATVLTVTRGEIADADFVVQDGKFVALGKHGEVEVPAGSQVHHLDGKVVIPGLVDTHSHIGIYPRPQVEAHQDGNEMTGAVQAGTMPIPVGDPQGGTGGGWGEHSGRGRAGGRGAESAAQLSPGPAGLVTGDLLLQDGGEQDVPHPADGAQA